MGCLFSTKPLFESMSPSSVPYMSVNQVSIGSDNGLLPERRQAITWTSAGLLSIGCLGTNFSGISIKIQNFSFTKMHLKILSSKRQPFWPGRDELRMNKLRSAWTHFTNNFWAHNPNLVTNICALDFNSNVLIRSQLCTCPDSSAVRTCAKLWPDSILIFWESATQVFATFWLWVKTAPDYINPNLRLISACMTWFSAP